MPKTFQAYGAPPRPWVGIRDVADFLDVSILGADVLDGHIKTIHNSQNASAHVAPRANPGRR
jgi:hypothetical protein